MSASRKVYDIREICDADYQGWLPLWLGYLAFYDTRLDEFVTRDSWHRFFVAGYRKCLLAVDEDLKTIIGFVTYLMHSSTWKLNGYCCLEDMFVDPSWRGQQVGERLIQSVVNMTTDAHIERVYWHTEQGNDVAQRLYDRVGEKSNTIQYRIESRQ